MVTHISPEASHVTIVKRSGRNRCREAILASCIALALFSIPSFVWADDSHKHRLINQQRVQDMKDKVADLRDQVQEQKHHHHTGNGVPGSIHNLELRVAALEAKVANMGSMTSFDPTTLLQAVQSLQNQVNDINNTKLPNLDSALSAKISDVNTKVDNSVVPNLKNYVEVRTTDMNGVKGPNLVFHGVNVHVQSGTGATADMTSGLGNLVIGYNEPNPNDAGNPAARLGAHNLVGGSKNSFSSFGGLVFGFANKVTGTFGTVVSGEYNTASGTSSSVLGGRGQSATWQDAISSQGASNPAAGL